MTDAEKREKVILGLRCHKAGFYEECMKCPYRDDGCETTLCNDAIALLREQEARVMTLEEIQERAETVDPDPVFVEWKSGATAWVLYTIDNIYYMAKRSYMGIRVWTSRPSPEQMRDTKWEGEKD